LFMLSYGYINIKTIKTIVPVFFIVLHMAYLTFILGNYIYKDFSNLGVYIFVRTTNRKKWLLQKYIHLFIYVLVYYIFQYIITYILGYLNGYKFINSDIFPILIIYFVTILFNYFFILVNNIMSFKFKSLFSYLITLSLYIIPLFISEFIYEFSKNNLYIIKFFPSSQGIIMWHQCSFLDTAFKLFDFSIKNFSIMHSIIYLIIANISLIIYEIYNIKSKEIL